MRGWRSGCFGLSFRDRVTHLSLFIAFETKLSSRELNELGFEIFIDDFGTGYSSLSYLAKYPIDGIKIDRVFVRDSETKSENQELIRSIVAMAAALNVMVIVEGVETIAQLKLVSDLGCQLVQGFIFTRPMNEQRAAEFLLSGGHTDVVHELACLNSADFGSLVHTLDSGL